VQIQDANGGKFSEPVDLRLIKHELKVFGQKQDEKINYFRKIVEEEKKREEVKKEIKEQDPYLADYLEWKYEN
jgi:hypothetical protein